jgi:transposase InsO family protein
MSKKIKYYAPNLLCSRFNVAQINKVWTLDDVSIQIKKAQTNLRILHIIDLSSRKILNVLCTTKDFNASHITRAIKILLVKHNISDFDNEELRLIIHTDRDTHFTSKTWWQLFQENDKKIRISMSPDASPKANAVSERFNRNLKHMSFETNEDLSYQVNLRLVKLLEDLPSSDQNIIHYKQIVNQFVHYYNEHHVHKTIQNTPSYEHHVHTVTEPIIGDPEIIASRNDGSSPIEHCIEIELYKEKLHTSFLEYDKYCRSTDDPNFQHFFSQVRKTLEPEFNELKLMMHKMALINQVEFQQTREQIDHFYDVIQQVKKKASKNKKTTKTLPLRDPVAFQLFQQIMLFHCSSSNLNELIAFSQFRVVGVLLYITGCRVNELRNYTYEDFEYALQNRKMSIIQPKTKSPRFAVMGEKAYQQLQLIQDDLIFLFKTHQFQYLGSTLRNKTKPMHPLSWIRSINRTLDRISVHFNINLILKSHSFRVGYITRHLKVSDLEKTAQLIGHQSLNTTRRYNRYLLNDSQNREITDKGFDVDINK